MVWTAKAVNDFLESVTTGAHVEFGYYPGKVSRREFKTFTEYSRECRRREGYFCIDTHRPSQKFWGKTPKAAAVAAGFTLPSSWSK